MDHGRDALAALNQRMGDVQEGRLDRPADVTFGALAAEYLVYKREQGKRSIREDERIIKRRLLPAFDAARPVRSLSTPLIAAYEKNRIGEVSAWTCKNELTILRHMLRLGRRWGYLVTVPDIDMPKVPRGRTRWLTEHEITTLLRACAESRNQHLGCIVTLAINTGMRKSEILGLTWERIELDTVLGFNARITLYETKNGEPRGVPVNTAAGAALTALEPDPAKRIGCVFKRRDGSDWGQIRSAFEKAVERAGLADFRFHDLRHTAASHLAMRGRALKEIQEILGHKSFSMTLRYAH